MQFCRPHLQGGAATPLAVPDLAEGEAGGRSPRLRDHRRALPRGREPTVGLRRGRSLALACAARLAFDPTSHSALEHDQGLREGDTTPALNHTPHTEPDDEHAHDGQEDGPLTHDGLELEDGSRRVEVGAEERLHIERFARHSAVAVIIAVVLAVVGLLTVPYWITVISHERERRFVEPYLEWITDLALDPVHPDVEAYVQALGADIAAQMDLPEGLELQIHVIDWNEVNAFATLGGHIFVLEGLIARLNNENSLAMVLAHEIAHAAQRDPLTSLSRGLLLQLLLSSATGNSSSSADVGSQLVLTAYSRELEETADRLALAALHRHYGHVGGATLLLERLLEEVRAMGSIEPGEILSTHPDLSKRILAIEEQSAERGWTVGATAPYPEAVVSALSSGL